MSINIKGCQRGIENTTFIIFDMEDKLEARILLPHLLYQAKPVSFVLDTHWLSRKRLSVEREYISTLKNNSFRDPSCLENHSKFHMHRNKHGKIII